MWKDKSEPKRERERKWSIRFKVTTSSWSAIFVKPLIPVHARWDFSAPFTRKKGANQQRACYRFPITSAASAAWTDLKSNVFSICPTRSLNRWKREPSAMMRSNLTTKTKGTRTDTDLKNKTKQKQQQDKEKKKHTKRFFSLISWGSLLFFFPSVKSRQRRRRLRRRRHWRRRRSAAVGLFPLSPMVSPSLSADALTCSTHDPCITFWFRLIASTTPMIFPSHNGGRGPQATTKRRPQNFRRRRRRRLVALPLSFHLAVLILVLS